MFYLLFFLFYRFLDKKIFFNCLKFPFIKKTFVIGQRNDWLLFLSINLAYIFCFFYLGRYIYFPPQIFFLKRYLRLRKMENPLILYNLLIFRGRLIFRLGNHFGHFSSGRQFFRISYLFPKISGPFIFNIFIPLAFRFFEPFK